jgi:hypothetical protein
MLLSSGREVLALPCLAGEFASQPLCRFRISKSDAWDLYWAPAFPANGWLSELKRA